jgi:hypothetical protein
LRNSFSEQRNQFLGVEERSLAVDDRFDEDITVLDWSDGLLHPNCPSAVRPDHGPTVTIAALDGTPLPFTRKSMYGPGGARLALVGLAALRLVPLAENVSG